MGSDDLGGSFGVEPSVLAASLVAGRELPEGSCHGGGWLAV